MRVLGFLLFWIMYIHSTIALPLNGCDLQRCENLLSKFKKPYFIPDVETLDESCGEAAMYLACVTDTMKICYGKCILDLASSENKSVSDFAKWILLLNDLGADICYLDSPIRRDFMGSIGCAKDIIRRMKTTRDNTCKRNSHAVVDGYLKSTGQYNSTRIGDSDWFNRKCLVHGYELNCAAHDIEKVCGIAARRLYVAVVKRIAVKELKCSPEATYTLKNGFLDWLPLDEQQRSTFLSLFELVNK